jgi:hypothetical protein
VIVATVIAPERLAPVASPVVDDLKPGKLKA